MTRLRSMFGRRLACLDIGVGWPWSPWPRLLRRGSPRTRPTCRSCRPSRSRRFTNRTPADKAKVMSDQKALLEKRYDLRDNAVGRADVRQAQGRAARRAREAAERHDLGQAGRHDAGADQAAERVSDGLPAAAAREAPDGRHGVSRSKQIDEIKKQEGRDLQRFDVDFDLPDHFTPEFPPPMFLTSRPDLGDVSHGEVLTIKNYYQLLYGKVTPVQMEGMRLLAHAESAAAVQPDRRPQGARSEPGRHLPRLPRERPHERHVPRESRHAAAGRSACASKR